MADPSNKKIMDLLVNPDPTNSWTYVVESGTNYRVQLGVANGVAVLNGSASLPVTQGGTGITSYTANNYIRALNSTTLEQRTPSQVLADIGGSIDSDVVHKAGSETISGVKTFTPGLISGADIDAGTNAVIASNFRSSNTSVVLGPNAAGTVFLRPDGFASATAQSSFTTTLATVGTNLTVGNNRVTGQQHAGPTTSVELGPTSSGTILLSPNGVGSGVSQVSISTSGFNIPTNLTVGASAALSGATFGSQLGASNTDLSKHLALYSTTFGFNITSGRMGVVFNGTDAGGWTAGGFNVNGNIAATGTVTAGSDERLKYDIRPIENPLDLVCSLEGKRFGMNEQEHVGVIAQQVRLYLPEVVVSTGTPFYGDPEGEDLLSVNYGAIVGPLIEAIKELRAQVDALKARVEILENE